MKKVWTKIVGIWGRLPLWAKIAIIVGIGVGIVLVLVARKRVAKTEWINRADVVFGPLSEEQKAAIRAIINAFDVYGDRDTNKLAYILATARHESRFRPIREHRARPNTQAALFDRQNRYWYSGYFGRGFVQLTWEKNYLKMSDIVGVDLVANPDKALEVPIAAKILVVGMMEGMFTRRALSEFINEQEQDYYSARKTVNGLDRAERIQGYALALVQGA